MACVQDAYRAIYGQFRASALQLIQEMTHAAPLEMYDYANCACVSCQTIRCQAIRRVDTGFVTRMQFGAALCAEIVSGKHPLGAALDASISLAQVTNSPSLAPQHPRSLARHQSSDVLRGADWTAILVCVMW